MVTGSKGGSNRGRKHWKQCFGFNRLTDLKNELPSDIVLEFSANTELLIDALDCTEHSDEMIELLLTCLIRPFYKNKHRIIRGSIIAIIQNHICKYPLKRMNNIIRVFRKQFVLEFFIPSLCFFFEVFIFCETVKFNLCLQIIVCKLVFLISQAVSSTYNSLIPRFDSFSGGIRNYGHFCNFLF
jgi:hypothetical protein